MEHKAIQYEILRTSDPVGWKWVAHIGLDETKTGFASSQTLATLAAIKAINKAVKEAKKPVRNRGTSQRVAMLSDQSK